MKIVQLHTQFAYILVFSGILFLKPLQAQTASLQTDVLKPNPGKEVQFLPYLAVRHGGMSEIETWKKQNTIKYYQELWYYTESFYIKRNHLSDGYTLDESILDISRFESQRKLDEEVTVILPGFKDVLILIPGNKLIYKPDYIQ